VSVRGLRVLRSGTLFLRLQHSFSPLPSILHHPRHSKHNVYRISPSTSDGTKMSQSSDTSPFDTRGRPDAATATSHGRPPCVSFVRPLGFVISGFLLPCAGCSAPMPASSASVQCHGAMPCVLTVADEPTPFVRRDVPLLDFCRRGLRLMYSDCERPLAGAILDGPTRRTTLPHLPHAPYSIMSAMCISGAVAGAAPTTAAAPRRSAVQAAVATPNCAATATPFHASHSRALRVRFSSRLAAGPHMTSLALYQLNCQRAQMWFVSNA
jgi:hypothetical protein